MNQKIIIVAAIIAAALAYFIISSESKEAPMPPPPPPLSEPVMASAVDDQAGKPNSDMMADDVAEDVVKEEAHPEFSDDGYPWGEELRPLNPSKPGYPLAARRAGVEGDVVASFVIQADGSTANCEINSAVNKAGEPINDFDRAVCATIEGFTYPPMNEAKSTRIKIHFNLEQE